MELQEILQKKNFGIKRLNIYNKIKLIKLDLKSKKNIDDVLENINSMNFIFSWSNSTSFNDYLKTADSTAML